MTITSIVTNPAPEEDVQDTSDGDRTLRPFYEALFGLDCAMDIGWHVTLEPGCAPMAQLDADADQAPDSGGPDRTIAVGDVDAVHARARRLGADVIQPPWTESWGRRRFFMRDPEGALVSVVEHDAVQARAA